MILTCSQCGTRFELDERRIPTRGARVRCSKCNNAFFVRPPEVEAETTLQGLVAETIQEAIPAPEPELDGVAPADLDITNPGLSEALEPLDEVAPDEWTFNEDISDPRAAEPAVVVPEVPEPMAAEPVATESVAAETVVAESAGVEPSSEESGSPFGEAGLLGKEDPLEAMAREVGGSTDLEIEPVVGVSPEPVTTIAREPEPEPRPDANEPAGIELAGLGDPADWDFLEDSVPAPPPEANIQQASPEVAEAQPAEPRRPVLSPRVKAWLETASGGLGWALCIGLILAGLGETLRGALVPGGVASPVETSVRGVEVRNLATRNLENLHAGSILIVSGVVAPRRSGPRGLRVQLLDAKGQPVEGALAWAGPALGERALRELDPKRLREEQGAASDALLTGGAFDAIFSAVPHEARSVALMSASLDRVSRGPLASDSVDPGAVGPASR